MKNKRLPDGVHEICAQCAKKHGGRWPEGHVATMWYGSCDVCGEENSLCSPSDYLWGRDVELKEWD